MTGVATDSLRPWGGWGEQTASKARRLLFSELRLHRKLLEYDKLLLPIRQITFIAEPPIEQEYRKSRMRKQSVDWFHRSPLIFAYKRMASLPDYLFWKLRGSPGPQAPHRIKERTVRQTAKRFGLRVLVETGTQYGQMIGAVRDDFAEIHSIELNEELFRAAKRNFARCPHIHLVHGDSAAVLPELLRKLSPPLLFWLDAHGDTSPLLEELGAILSDPAAGHVVLIDDAHAFDGNTWAPTVDAIRQYVANRAPGYGVEVRDNIVHVHPAQGVPDLAAR